MNCHVVRFAFHSRRLVYCVAPGGAFGILLIVFSLTYVLLSVSSLFI